MKSSISFALFALSLLSSSNVYAGEGPPEWIVQLGDGDNACASKDLISPYIQNGDNACNCTDIQSSRSVTCVYNAPACPLPSRNCATVDIVVDLTGEGASITHIATFDVEYEQTALELNVQNNAISNCSATYGSNSCDCTPCDNGTGFDLDCYIHNPGAITGCQTSSPLNPIVPNFMNAQQLAAERAQREAADAAAAAASTDQLIVGNLQAESASAASTATGMLVALMAIFANFLM